MPYGLRSSSDVKNNFALLNNRVVVATNLKLRLDKLPGYLMLGDILKINAHLEEDGKSLIDQRLLSKFKFLLKRNILECLPADSR